jgi:glycosyltransferase involved in cell wall biosynthesis
MKIALLIPAYCPNLALIELVRELLDSPFEKIVVVNDGSGRDYDMIFGELKSVNTRVLLLEHETNRGKGAALKTGFSYLLQFGGDIDGVVTADADGQHTSEDIINVAELIQQNNTIVLGFRQFEKTIPFRSQIGNRITKGILKLFFGLDLSDTQTGLRGLSLDTIPLLVTIPYDRYEYELEMLLVCKRNGVSFIQTPIKTIYLNDNKSSHFNPLVDSTKIYFVLFRYVIASIITAIVDYILFVMLISATNNVLLSTLAARGVALTVNYSLLRLIVFQVKTNISKSFLRYILLVLASGLVSAFLTSTINRITGLEIILAKAISELILYSLVFWIQKTIIFARQD